METTAQVRGKRWTNYLSYCLIVVSVILLAAWLVVRWADTRIFNTDSWVATVAPLPKDPTVSSALARYTVSNILDQTNAAARIQDALPPKASFLAGPLYDQINTRSTRLAASFIASDQFQSIWTAANRFAMSSLLTRARASQSAADNQKQTKLQLGLSDLRQKVVNNQKLQALATNHGPPTIAVNLKTSFAKFRDVVRTADFLNGVLPYVTLATVLGAIALARRRLRAFWIIVGSSAVMSLLVLIGVKLLKSSVVDMVAHAENKPAVDVVVSQLSANLKTMATNLFFICVGLLAVSIALHFSLPYLRQRFSSLKNNRFARWTVSSEQMIQRYSRYILGAFMAVLLIDLSFSSNAVGWTDIINAVALTVIVASGLWLLKPPVNRLKPEQHRGRIPAPS